MSTNSSSTTPAPKPGPRPGAHILPSAVPKKTPAAAPAPSTARPASTLAQIKKFGRIDDNGDVYVRTATDERLIGSWQAGSVEEGLLHYGHRYDDLATEIELLNVRLASHPAEAATLRAQAEAIADTLGSAAVIGDIALLERQLAGIITDSFTAEEQAKETKAQQRAQAIARKEQLVAEAEELAAHSTEWKKAGDRLRDILEEWRTIKGVDRSTDDALWKRYSEARASFNHRRGAHFSELDKTRAAAKRAKEELVERAEALKDSTDWAETARAYRDLLSEWKKAGRAHREADDRLWAQFKAAQDHFFGARDADAREKDEKFEANAAAKDALIAEYTPLIDPATDLEGARLKLRELQDKWEAIGYVPRGRVSEYEDKIAALERTVSDYADAQWRRTDPEAQARVKQFQDKVEELQAQVQAAEASGKTAQAADLRAQAEQWSQWAQAAAEALEQR